jgi:hypothetical protein
VLISNKGATTRPSLSRGAAPSFCKSGKGSNLQELRSGSSGRFLGRPGCWQPGSRSDARSGRTLLLENLVLPTVPAILSSRPGRHSRPYRCPQKRPSPPVAAEDEGGPERRVAPRGRTVRRRGSAAGRGLRNRGEAALPLDPSRVVEHVELGLPQRLQPGQLSTRPRTRTRTAGRPAGQAALLAAYPESAEDLVNRLASLRLRISRPTHSQLMRPRIPPCRPRSKKTMSELGECVIIISLSVRHI